MKYITIVFLLIIMTVLVFARANQVNSNKKKATFIEQGKSVEFGETSVRVVKNASGFIEVQQNGNQVGRRSKEKEPMGSASSSGPAVKIQKINAKPTVSIQEVARSLDNDGETKKRSK